MLNKPGIFLQNELCLKNVSLLEVDGEEGIQGPWQKGLPPPGSLVLGTTTPGFKVWVPCPGEPCSLGLWVNYLQTKVITRVKGVGNLREWEKMAALCNMGGGN